MNGTMEWGKKSKEWPARRPLEPTQNRGQWISQWKNQKKKKKHGRPGDPREERISESKQKAVAP